MLKVPGGGAEGCIGGGMCIKACCRSRSLGNGALAAGAVVSFGGPPTSATRAPVVPTEALIYSGYQASSCLLNAGKSPDESVADAAAAYAPKMGPLGGTWKSTSAVVDGRPCNTWRRSEYFVSTEDNDCGCGGSGNCLC